MKSLVNLEKSSIYIYIYIYISLNEKNKIHFLGNVKTSIYFDEDKTLKYKESKHKQTIESEAKDAIISSKF